MKNTLLQTGRGTVTWSVLLAIWSISAVVSLPGLAISPILGDLDRIFPHATRLEIQMLTSLPSLLIIPCVLLAGRLSASRDKMRILFSGLGLFFLSGLLCLFAKSMWLLIVINCILGIGAGMVIPLSTGLIADYFTGRYRVRQLGISSSISNLTLVVATSATGWLATVDWHLPFLVYTLPGISILLARALIHTPAPVLKAVAPDSVAGNDLSDLDPAETKKTTPYPAQDANSVISQPAPATETPPLPTAATGNPSVDTPSASAQPTPPFPRTIPVDSTPELEERRLDRVEGEVRGALDQVNNRLFGGGIDLVRLGEVMALYFFATYVVLVVSFNLPFLMQHYAMSSSAAGVMISLFFLAIMVPGLFITKIIDRLAHYTIFTAFALITAGLATILFVHDQTAIALGCILTGLGYGIIQPIAYDKAVIVTRADKATFSLALVMSVNYLAILACPFIVAFFRELSGSAAPGFPFLLNGSLALAVTVLSWRYHRTFGLGVDPANYK